MKYALTLALLLASPLTAQTLPEEAPDERGLWERGADRLLQNLLDEMAPALDEAEQAFREMEPTFRAMLPMMRELAEMVGDIDHYHMPEKLPNGDILLRRKPDLPPEPETPPERDPERPMPQPGLPDLGPGEQIEI
ncbi:AAA+ family ATPase [Frigidibacter albus]|uniref:AAA+ family ATPase n=1 Tax=Frigidibacter albus TaxID=1465486 RepID=A0A6L8VDI1_9RHOB|nr:AAA+ family ATPase [Frigidibacter albus]MZQ88264.1 AAA+ family ATPase [Frigidibacter albus]NBE30062.1 AAA+ family ATPase [Frigidibacter albus]GGH46466.1 hypothetical protein GCM10011341_06970 [Frigidibacter albus]